MYDFWVLYTTLPVLSHLLHLCETFSAAVLAGTPLQKRSWISMFPGKIKFKQNENNKQWAYKH